MKLRQVVFHAPGPMWEYGVGFREQPGVMAHVEHYAKFKAEGKLYLGGPFTNVDSGGMMIAADSVSLEELEAYAASDPAIANGLLTYEIKTWYIAMSD
ncbi:MAG: YciI family protein [Chloroflexota bacterium]